MSCQIVIQESLSAPYLFNQKWNQTKLRVLYQLGELNIWLDFGSNFQGHHSIKAVKWAVSAVYLVNQWVDSN